MKNCVHFLKWTEERLFGMEKVKDDFGGFGIEEAHFALANI